MSLSFESSFSGPPTDTSSNIASSSSTPPTTVADSASLHSDTSKHDVITVADDAVFISAESAQPPSSPTTAAGDQPSSGRASRRVRVAPIYNIAKLSGTASHGKRRANGDIVAEKRRHTTGDLLSRLSGGAEQSKTGKTTGRGGRSAIDALDLRNSPAASQSPRTRRQTRESPRSQRLAARTPAGTSQISNLGKKLSSLGKRSRKSANQTPPKTTRELRRLEDTKEYSHIDDVPVVYTVWANGKYVDPNAPVEPARKRVKVEEPPAEEAEKEDAEPITNTRKRRVKKYLGKGLYAGQEMPADLAKGLTTAEKKKLAQLPELTKKTPVNKTMPQPIYTGFRMLIAGRDFKLPYQVCNPLPPGQPKPDEWKRMTKNRFIGDSKEFWKKSPHNHDYSKCVCKVEDGCGESCQNRIMLYECDAANCNVGKENCTNRAFADLTVRRSKGGKYRVGVEVIKTSDRGYGVRSNRCFEANQIIMEYAGEIITEEECERRMNEEYKNNECYYLMSFDQNMIIDATTGSIARFVNHSCNPNCRMVKWIVSGQPRMALFAGDRPISTGDELTYDYNFDPFSAKNVQKCLCGEHNCRGVLGPKPREVKPPKTDLKKVVKASVKAGKRKLKELIGDDGDESSKGKANKKRKIQPAKGAKGSAKVSAKVSAKTTKKTTAKGALKKTTKAVAKVTAKSGPKKAAVKGLKKTTTKTTAKATTKTTAKNAAKGAAKGVAKTVRKTVSTIKVNAKQKKAGVSGASPVKKGSKPGLLFKKATTKKVVTTYKRATPAKKEISAKASSSTTIVAMGDGASTPTKTSPRKRTPTKKAADAAERVEAKLKAKAALLYTFDG